MSTIRLFTAGVLAFVVASAGFPAVGAGAQTDEERPEETGIATPPPVEAHAADALATATATYTFGTAPLAAVMNSAASASAAASCSISRNGLAALMLAPTFLETGAGSVATPAPMTLSRYDRDVALYSMSDPTTHPRAFWHPGIGVWQFDGAGGWGKTAFERIDIGHIADLAADVMVGRYCTSVASGASSSTARAAAWRPWVACRRNNACEGIFQAVYDGQSGPLDVETDGSVGVVGGAIASTCAHRGCLLAPASASIRRAPRATRGGVGRPVARRRSRPSVTPSTS